MDKMHAQIIERLDRIEALLTEIVKDQPVTLSTLKAAGVERPAPRVVTKPKPKK